MSNSLADLPLVSLTDGVLTLPISTKDNGTSLDNAALHQALTALQRVEAGQIDAGAILLTGLGPNFCAGGNLRDFAALPDRGARVGEVADLLHAVVLALHNGPLPVVAAVTGWAAGAGMSLVLSADVSVASTETRLRTAYSAIAFTPDAGLTWLLSRAVGYNRAASLILLDTPLNGQQAFDMGIITTLVEPEELADQAVQIARKLAAGPRGTFASARQLLKSGQTGTLAESLRAERDSIAAMANSADGREGVDAFLAKRRPQFGA